VAENSGMPMFIDPADRVAVEDGQGNTVWIKALMDASTKALVTDAIGAKGVTQGGKDQDPELKNLGSHKLALLEHNVLAWEGPAFEDKKHRPLPCNRFNIRKWNPRHPLYKAVAEKIGELNADPDEEGDEDPNALGASGSTSAGA
jgi:hypothetical protein